MALLGVLALINFFAIIMKLSFVKTISLITLIVSLGTFGLFSKVGNTGGKIRHSEIRANEVTKDNGIFKGGTKVEHDDDD